ncbi:MAG TPA: GatB/YqeY domain-containing protein, partial [Vulgatibacter sp.]
ATGPLDDAGIVQVIVSEVKKRRDSVAEYEKAARTDLADKERAEIGILQAYLPAQLEAHELEKLVAEAIAEAQASGPKDMGKVMKVLGPRTQGRADGKVVADLVKQKLAG